MIPDIEIRVKEKNRVYRYVGRVSLGHGRYDAPALQVADLPHDEV